MTYPPSPLTSNPGPSFPALLRTSSAAGYPKKMCTPPPPVRELMRRNTRLDVLDPAANRVVGVVDPGRAMRESLLV